MSSLGFNGFQLFVNPRAYLYAGMLASFDNISINTVVPAYGEAARYLELISDDEVKRTVPDIKIDEEGVTIHRQNK